MKQPQHKIINIILGGAAGRMASYITELSSSDHLFHIEYATYNSNNAVDLPILDLSNSNHNSDIIIDFSTPSHSMELLEYAKRYKIPFLTGVTAFSDEQIAEMRAASQIIPVFLGPNMSASFNAFLRQAVSIAETLGIEYDIEILDIHHKNKKDAPSGAAYMLLKALQKARDLNPIIAERFTNSAAKSDDEIGISSMRSGSDMVGEHRVIFASQDDRIEIMHRSANQIPYAKGALLAAKWLLQQGPGFYGISDLF